MADRVGQVTGNCAAATSLLMGDDVPVILPSAGGGSADIEAAGLQIGHTHEGYFHVVIKHDGRVAS